MMFKKVKNIFIGITLTFMFVGCQNSDTNVQAQSPDSAQKEAKVVLTEYSDFQCPACGYFFPMVEKLKKEYGDKLEVNYHHFPLNSHQYAMLAARAAESARNQGEFEAMHDLLFENQRQWSSSGNPEPTFVNYAKRIGLDINQFKEDLNSADTQRSVIEEKKAGQERGVNSTPTFYINDEEVVSLPQTYEQFKALVNVYMQEAEKAAN